MGRGLLCVSVSAADAASVVTLVQPVQALADVIEIRLDGMQDPDISLCCARLAKPILATNRPCWEGGEYAGGETERITELLRAIVAGASYVDIELATAHELRRAVFEEARRHRVRVIVSSHNFSATPKREALSALLAEIRATGADIGKIVSTALAPGDALRILSLHEEALAASFPLTAFAMGEAGRISRFATLHLGGYMSYSNLDASRATAAGQLSLAHLRALSDLFEERS